jgi:hypothetical protein
MSALTRWLLIAAGLLLVVFVLNAIAYRIRFGTFLRRSRASSELRRALPRSEVVLYAVFVLGLLAGVAAPVLTPASAFAVWLSEPYAKVAYFAWCFLATGVAGVLMEARARFGRSEC